MSNHFKIIYQNRENTERIRGLALPIFIHNGSYFMDTLEIYEDGLVECWGLISLKDLPEKMNKNWVTIQAPIGKNISMHDLGDAVVKDAEWLLSPEIMLEHVQKAFQQLNPKNENIADLQAMKKAQAAKHNIPENMIGLSRRNPHIYRITESADEVLGEAVPLFYVQGDTTLLTNCIIYQNEMAQIGFDDSIIPIEKIHEMLKKDIIATSVPDETWVSLDGLGRFQVTDGYWWVEKDELWKEIQNKLASLNGQEDCIEQCYQAFLAYGENPNQEKRQVLKEKYEAVPKHHRIFTQRDMDSKDHDIKRILYHDLDNNKQ